MNPPRRQGGDDFEPPKRQGGDDLNPPKRPGGDDLNPPKRPGGDDVPKIDRKGDDAPPKIDKKGDDDAPKIDKKGDEEPKKEMKKDDGDEPKKEMKKDENETGLARPGRVVVELPAGADLFIDGQPVRTTSGRRTFSTPDLQPGKEYYYTLRAEVERDGKVYSETRRVFVEAGKTARASFGALANAGRAPAGKPVVAR